MLLSDSGATFQPENQSGHGVTVAESIMEILFNLSDKAIRSYLLQGKECPKQQVIKVNFAELTQEQREVLVSHLEFRTSPVGLGYPDMGKLRLHNRFYVNNRVPGWILEFNSVELPEILAELIAADEAYLLKSRKEQEEKLFRLQQNYKNMIGVNLSDYSEMYMWAIIDDEGVRSFIEEAKKQQEAERKAAAEATMQQSALEAAERVARKEAIENWARENGSPLLRGRLEIGANWRTLAQEEYADSYADGYTNLTATFPEWSDVDDWPIKNPTLEQIEILKTERAIHPSANLRRYKVCSRSEDCYHISVVEIQVVCPDGETLYRQKTIEDVTE